MHSSVSVGQRRLHSLILSDGPRNRDSLSCVAPGAVEEPAAIADALRGNQDPLCVQPIEQITESLPFRSEEHTSELQSHLNLVCRLLLEKKKKTRTNKTHIESLHVLYTQDTFKRAFNMRLTPS